MTKKTTSNIFNIVNDIANLARQRGIAHLYTEDETYNGRTIKIKGQDLINFGSCSYLGLEIDERLKEAAIEAIRKYGIQFSSSRSYVACTLYTEWENLITKLFNAPVILPPTTTLGHHAVIPVVVEDGDVIILDQQVHASVQDAALKMQLKGVKVIVVRHNHLDELEAKIVEFAPHCNKIWYMADGIYSMYGDYAPIEELVKLLNLYKQFHIYMDDSHGMSIMGKNGAGYVMSKVGIQEKMIIACSFAKAFGGGGAAIIFPNADLARKVKNCGGPMIFSGPHQIPVIAAGIASAKIHLSDEIYQFQSTLKEKLNYCHMLLRKYNLPVVSNPDTPIFFIGLGLA
jgi:7-keto-8-aminopelargonate synthetase-like enzyme